MLRSYLPAIVFVLLGGAVGSLFAVLNTAFGVRRSVSHKDDPYESGLPSEIKRGLRFGISFYLVAMLFILFDIEVVFLYPWAVVYKEMLQQNANLIFGSMVSFMGILFVGYLYAVKKHAFDWKS